MTDKIKILGLAILFTTAAIACKKDTPAVKPAGPTQTIYQLVQADSAEFSILNKILSATHVGDTLSRFSDTLRDTGSYTLFAPTDAYFIQAGITKDSVAHMQLGNMALMAKYLISYGAWPTSSFPAGAEMQVLQVGNSFDQHRLSRYAYLTHHTANDSFYIDGVPLLEHDIPASNGILHKLGGITQHSSYDLATTVSTRFPYFNMSIVFYKDATWSSATDTTAKTIFLPIQSAATDYQNTYGFIMYQLFTAPGLTLFYPDFYDWSGRQTPTNYKGNGYYTQNIRFVLSPGPGILGPQDYGTPINIIPGSTIVTTNGVIYLTDQILVPYSYPSNQ